LSDKLEQRLKAKKARTLKKRVTILITLIAAIAVIVLLLQMVNSLDRRAPTYSEFSTTSARTGASLMFRALWNDNVNVSGYIFESNITGTFSNDTWVPFSTFANSTSAYSTAVKTFNSATGDVIQWRFWCNDSGNNWRSTNLFLDSNRVLLVTSMGNITIELYDDMPITTGNFKCLVNKGIFDETIFHRVIKDFVVQGGDPSTAGNGETIPTIQDEYSANESHNLNDRSTVAMAKTDQPNSASSQFFINLKYNSDLDSSYSVFGKVVSGMDVADAIGNVATDTNDRPLQAVTLVKAQLIG
jgi:peptidylprolyl isomerase